ncbi:hypothetical protein HOLleu_28779 [Holothuria leucospilota]|uniref:Uncharacterized protein n=1 Tax=Holothuria leucospilota TaxID=206669 RepID=A0A9Q1H1Q2_HOLLE|nr:hypothetical protein HOLleu_28779 [Holothuria leucospilota]
MEILRATTVLLILAFIAVAHSARWDAKRGWCGGRTNFFLGDFNGDSRTDFLCHRPSDGYIAISFANAKGQFNGTSWRSRMRWCYRAGSEIFIGDFNGDGRSDMLCHDTKYGRKQVALAKSNGVFSRHPSWLRTFRIRWCSHGGAKLHIGDFNGDRRDDMLCHDTKSGYYIAYANERGLFSRTNWKRRMGLCRHSGGQLFIGDFNGDSRDDLLCHDKSGNKSIVYANSAGNFGSKIRWKKALGFCRNPSQLCIGNFNEDLKEDLLCHDHRSGKKWVALANGQSNFSGGTSWEASLGWCRQSTAEFHVGDFNGDHVTDMLCHDTKSGKNSIIYADFQSTIKSIFQ